MAPNRGRNRSGDFDQFTDAAAPDFDPEAEDVLNVASDSEGDSEDDVEQNGARDHYVETGKSKLRQPKVVPLGPQYRGSRISRDDVTDDEEEDDPFGRGFEEEDSEEEQLNGHDLEELEASSDEEDDGDLDDLNGVDGDETSDTEMSDEGNAADAEPAFDSTISREEKQALVREMDSARNDVSRLIQSNQADAEKGRAVKQQRAAFDALLGTRIKLQKALIGTNTIVALPTEDLAVQHNSDAAERAEAAAFNLWSSLNSLREDIAAARAGDKRKRNQFTSNTPTHRLWSHMQSQEESSLAHRTAILQRWSRKARNETVRPQNTLLGKTERQSTVIDTINEHLSNKERLLKRAHIPRSCAPLQVSNKVTEDDKIYDDADFYGLLLKELLEQKSQDSAMASNIDLDFNLHREAKTKKNVDTKASKGRKLRYTVHEKLQNFMAPEDRRMWGERQAEELFGSLLGQRLGLAEDVREDEEMGDIGDGANAADEALMLFRS